MNPQRTPGWVLGYRAENELEQFAAGPLPARAGDLRLDDLKGANADFIGSVGGNRWAAIADNNANFHIVYRQGGEGATIINQNPQPGEQASYESHWNEPAHGTFALIAFPPNMGGNAGSCFCRD
jgi:hypothetical protein